jgi:hypothetical protein
MAISDYFKYWSASGTVQGLRNQVMTDNGLNNLRALNDMNAPNYVGNSYFQLIQKNNPLSPSQGAPPDSETSLGLWVAGLVILLLLLILKD